MELQYELMVFTLFMCLAAGIFLVQGVLAFLDTGKKVQVPALIVSVVALGIGGIGSFLHLQHVDRIFNGFGNLTSGITQELIAIVVFVIALIVYFIMIRRSGEGRVARWVSIMAIVVSAILIVVVALSYMMAARPAWNTFLLPVMFLANGFFFGSLCVACLSGFVKDDEGGSFSAKLSWIAGIVAAVVTAAYTVFLATLSSAFTDVGHYFDPTQPTKPMEDVSSAFTSIFTGDLALLFWVGVVLIGLVVAIVLAFLSTKKEGMTLAAFAGGALICALIGGFCFRVIFYSLGFSVFLFY